MPFCLLSNEVIGYGHERQTEPVLPCGSATECTRSCQCRSAEAQGGRRCWRERCPAAIEPHRLEKAVNDINEFIQAAQRKLDFSIDDSTHQVVVKVIATESGEVIRQIPSELALKLAQSLHDASSLLFDAKV